MTTSNAKHLMLGIIASCCLPASGFALDLLDSSASFVTTQQSIWNSGGAFDFNYSEFFGNSYNTGSIVIDPPRQSGSISIIGPDPTWSVDPYMTLSSTGTAGLQVGANVHGGSVDANLDYRIHLSAPDSIRQGEYFSLSGSAAQLSSSAFNTNPLNASAFIDARLTVNNNGYYRVDTGGSALSDGRYIARDGLVDINYSQELIAFNRDGSGQLNVLGSSVGGVGTAFEAGYGTITAGDPRLSTADDASDGVLQATGNTTLLTASLDVDAALTGGSPVTGLRINPDLGPEVTFDFGYDVVDFDAGLALGLAQRFGIAAEVLVTLTFSDLVALEDGSLVDIITAPIGSLPQFALQSGDVLVTPEFHLDAIFSNDTDLTFTGLLDLAVLQGQARFILDIDNLLYSYNRTLVDRSAGPIYGWGDTYSLGAIDVLSSSFALGGFNSWTGDSFLLTTAVPVPPALWLMLSGLFGLVGVARSR